MIVVIPLGGIGKRFADFGYSMPKPLIKVFGKEIIFWVLSSLKITKKDKLFIIYHRNLELFNFEKIILEKFQNVRLFKLPIDTHGPVETINIFLKFLEKNYDNEKILLNDGDLFYDYNILPRLKKTNHSALIYFITKKKDPIYSYITFKNGVVNRIAEKKKISSNANISYFFLSVKKLKEYIKLLRQKKKAYISDIFRGILERKDEKIKAIKIPYNKVSILGTPSEIQEFISKKNIPTKKFSFNLNSLFFKKGQIIDFDNINYTNINFLNSLYLKKHKIIIEANQKEISSNLKLNNLKKKLNMRNVNFHKILISKKNEDFSISSNSISSNENLQYSLGFQDKPITRNFNFIEVGENYTLKKSSNIKKIQNEVKYYKNLPDNLKMYFPKLFNTGRNFYRIETVKGANFRDLYNNSLLLKNDISNLFNVLDKIHKHNVRNKSNTNIYQNYLIKFESRLKKIKKSDLKKNKNLINKIRNFLKFYEKKKLGKRGLIHGDPTFSNIFKTISNKILFIDPRASNYNVFSIESDIFYDYAKVYQSLIGFETIIKKQKLVRTYEYDLKRYFEEIFIMKYGYKRLEFLRCITASLLVSLIPLQDEKNSSLFMRLAKKILH